MKKPKPVDLQINQVSTLVKLAATLVGCGIVYGSLSTRLSAEETKNKEQDSKLSIVATKEDVREVRNDFRALAQALGHGRVLPPLLEQNSQLSRGK